MQRCKAYRAGDHTLGTAPGTEDGLSRRSAE